MFMLDGSAAHKHTITDFKTTGGPNTSGNTTTYNGTATVSLKAGPAKDVPISIKLMGDSALSIWVDPSKTENHFGNTPIYGAQHRIA
jgi:Rieske Fe-S protein